MASVCRISTIAQKRLPPAERSSLVPIRPSPVPPSVPETNETRLDDCDPRPVGALRAGEPGYWKREGSCRLAAQSTREEELDTKVDFGESKLLVALRSFAPLRKKRLVSSPSPGHCIGTSSASIPIFFRSSPISLR